MYKRPLRNKKGFKHLLENIKLLILKGGEKLWYLLKAK